MKKENTKVVHQTEELTLLTSEEWFTKDCNDRHERRRKEKDARATRLDENWCPRIEDYDWAAEQGYDKLVSISIETEKFIDYWCDKPGKAGRKLSWWRTWRNWIRNAVQWKQERQQKQRPASSEWDELHRDATE